MPLLICSLYIAAHAGLYFVALRKGPALSSEKGIFFYHFISAMVVCAGTFVWVVATGGTDAWAWFVSVVMLHGIYSLSLLELWALADDSYSLAMMEAIHRRGTERGEALVQGLETIGTRKQSLRLDSLKRIGVLDEASDGAISLTSTGRAVYFFGRGLLFLVNVRKYG